MSQAADINALFGFRIECIERLGERNGLWAWTRLNSLFNWLPLAACIEDKVLCMHGGERSSAPRLLNTQQRLITPVQSKRHGF